MKSTQTRQMTQLKHILNNQNIECVKRNKIRLEKLPPNKDVLADREYAVSALSYPNLNNQICPFFLDGLQYQTEEVSMDRTKCNLRYSSETHFSRVTDTTALKDWVSRGFFSQLEHINNWGHGCANLQEPLYITDNDTHFEELEERRKDNRKRKRHS